jgi:SAM-dependent methyltransferase
MQAASISNEPIQADQSAPAAMAHEAIYDTVLRIVHDLPAGKLLDAPTGEGALAMRLIDAGFDVRCCDLYPEIFKLEGVDVRQADLGAALPYPDASFSYVTCIEGLEHIENPQNAIREFSRLLKDGGHLVVSVPNILNIEERLKWLLYGYTSHFKPLTREALENARRAFGNKLEVALHINPIGYSELRYTLEANSFEIVRLYRDKPKSGLWLYWPLVALIRLIGHLTPMQKRRERWTADLQSDEVLMGGNTLIGHAEN